VDDLSMLIATATVLHRVFTFDKSLSITVTSGLLITAIMAAFSTWHCITDELTMHSVLFGLMIAAIGLKTRSIISARVSNPAIKAQVFKLCTWGSIIFVTGFAIWNVDNAICGKLTQWKRVIGMPWSFLLELHGWWHVFTGAGAYIFIALVEYLTSEDAGKPLGGRFAFPAAWIVDGEAGKAEGNGHAYSNGKAKANVLNGNANGCANGNAMENGSNGFANGKANGNGNAKKTI
jgi:dihydroceramidase